MTSRPSRREPLSGNKIRHGNFRWNGKRHLFEGARRSVGEADRRQGAQSVVRQPGRPRRRKCMRSFCRQRSCRVRICEPRRGIRIVCGKVAAVTFRAQIESQENRTALFFLPFYRIQRDTAGVCRPVLIASRAGFYFCGPPYAESSELLDGLLHEKSFTAWAERSLMIWELPEANFQLKVFPPEWKVQTIKQFGGTRFLYIVRT